MSDVVVTVPMRLWDEWLGEGDLPSEPWSGDEYHFYLGGPLPKIEPGERVYVVAHGAVRGYAPLVRIEHERSTLLPHGHIHEYRPLRWALVRHGGAVAVTLGTRHQDERLAAVNPGPFTAHVPGFRGWRYRWWDRADEIPFPDWRTP